MDWDVSLASLGESMGACNKAFHEMACRTGKLEELAHLRRRIGQEIMDEELCL